MLSSISNLDFEVFEYIYKLLHQGEASSTIRSHFNHFFTVANSLGEFFILIPIIFIIAVTSHKRHIFWARMLFVVSALLISTIIFAIPKNVVKRDRPYAEYMKRDGKLPAWFTQFQHVPTDVNEPTSCILKKRGFPSGHTNFAFTIAGIMIVIFRVKIGIFFLFWAFFTGIGRIYGGLHFPGDVVGGMITGSLGVISTVLIYRGIGHYYFKFRSLYAITKYSPPVITNGEQIVETKHTLEEIPA